MKYLLLCCLLLLETVARGQRSHPVSKIVIEYSKGDVWGEKGGKGEVIEISPINFKYFKIIRHLTINYAGGRSWKMDTILIDPQNYPLIPKSKILYFINQLQATKNNFNASFVKPRLTSPSKQMIMSIALQDTLTYRRFLDKDMMEDARRSAIMDKIENFDKLDTFLDLKKPDPRIFIAIADSWDALSINIIRKSDTIFYSSNFDMLLGQPLLLKKEKNKKRFRQFINLEINTSLSDLLPRSSFIKENTDLNSLSKEYIKWYLSKEIK